MTLGTIKSIFGVHELVAYNPDTLLPLGKARVIGTIENSSEGELIPLNGGSSPYAYKVERGLITSEISMTLREYPDFLFETLLGIKPTVNAAETGGFASTLTNEFGISLVDASTGIATVSVKAGSEADVKFSKYVVKAVSPTTVDVFGLSDVDFANGTPQTFIDDSLKITTTPLTITASTAVEIPGFGVELTGGSGVVAMTVNDTASFETRPINQGSTSVVVGSTSEVFKDFGLIITSKRAGDKTMIRQDLYRVAGSGLPINFGENAFSEASISAQLYRDEIRNGLYEYQYIQATN